MTFIQSLIAYKKSNVVDFDTPKGNKATPGYIVKHLLLPQLTDIKKNYKQYVRLIDLLNHYVNDTVEKINSKVMIQSFVRKQVKEIYGEDSKQYSYLKSGFSMTSSEKGEREQKSKDKVRTNNENQILVSVEQIQKFKHNLLEKKKVKDPEKPRKFNVLPVIITAQLCSGCRLIEILSNEFEFKPSEVKENYIIQSNVAKNRTSEERAVEKPVLFTSPAQFVKLIEIIRRNIIHKPNDTNITLSSRYDNRVNETIKKLAIKSGMPDGINSSHDMRKIYANYSHKLLAPANYGISMWIASVLGHGDTNSAVNYSTLRIID
jgi:hypothetical protein